MRAILFIVTSHDRMSSGEPTGVRLGEYALPWTRLTAVGGDA